ncbi:hypothetical protein NPIL_686411 [Nephila pilipes]|uniref:Uncharacterized protein n=1 Tax=Nephila pilipes TaxID=299642 RepID=A0A8X6Q7R0_NEPPI|nr:hypothetical protein NPIL_686411 [Nephila pilipes]
MRMGFRYWILFFVAVRFKEGCGLFRETVATGIREKRSGHHDEEDHHEEDNEENKGHHEDHYELINSLFRNYDPSSSPTHGTVNYKTLNSTFSIIGINVMKKNETANGYE